MRLDFKVSVPASGHFIPA